MKINRRLDAKVKGPSPRNPTQIRQYSFIFVASAYFLVLLLIMIRKKVSPLKIFFLLIFFLAIASQPIPQSYASVENATYDLQLEYELYGIEEAGVSVSTGDFNNDGYDDLAVGAPNYNSRRGKVYIYYGTSSGLPASADASLMGEASNNYFGYAISATGDANNDGYSDLVIGAYGNSSSTGKAYLYLGSASGIQASPSQTVAGEGSGNRFGYSVAFAGHTNNDSYDDVMIGAYKYNTDTGRVYIYSGTSSGIATSPERTLEGESTNNSFGFSIAKAGDTNNDSYDDIVIGAKQYNSYTGRLYVYNGSASGIPASPTQTITGESGEDLGESVASAGDTNNDGYDDVIAGAGDGNSGQGAAYIYLGGASGTESSASSMLTAGDSGNYFGFVVSSVGDINNDSYDDVIVGQEGYAVPGVYTGRAYLYYGNSSGVPNTVGITFASPGGGAEFAGYRTPITYGDYKGNDAINLAIGAPGYPTQDYDGTVYVYYGTPPPTPTPTPTSEPSSPPSTTTPTPDPITPELIVNSASGGTISAVNGTATLIVPSAEQPTNQPTYFWFIPRTNADIQAGNSIAGQSATVPPSIINNSITQIFQLDPSNLTTGEHITVLPEPIIISIPVTKQVPSSRARLYFYNTTTRRWQTVNVPLVFNPLNQTVAFTTKNAGLYIVSATLPPPVLPQNVQGASTNNSIESKKSEKQPVIQKLNTRKTPKIETVCGFTCSISLFIKNISPFH